MPQDKALKERRRQYFPVASAAIRVSVKTEAAKFKPSHCLHCGHHEVRLVKVVWVEETDRETHEPTGKMQQTTTYNFTEVCTNKACWAYLDTAKIKSWKRT